MLTLSVVVVVYNIPREAPRTLFSLSADYQREIEADDYEVLVVDNGSTPAFDPGVLDGLRGNFRLIRIDNAPASPAFAVNRGLKEARGAVIGVLIDGARLVTPGLLRYALVGANTHPRAVVASLGWYLGGDVQGVSLTAGYTQSREDALLSSIDWPSDGYRLFEVGTIDESSVDGWVAPTIAETNTLFMRREQWDLLGGFDERFDAAGGGLVNLDTYRRALELPHAEPVVLLGEASFHQLHGGVSTNATRLQQRDNWERWHSQYRHLRGHDWNLVEPKQLPTLVGRLQPAALPWFLRSATNSSRPEVSPLGRTFDHGIWSSMAPARPLDDVTAALVDLAHAELRSGRPGVAGAVARLARHRDADDPELRRILSLTAHHADAQTGGAHLAVALARAHRLIGDLAGAEAQFRTALAHDPGFVEAHVGLAELRMPADHYLVWLQWLYDLLAPASALEIGVYHGQSLALHRPPTVAIGIDPRPAVTQPLQAETHIFAQTSDEFFSSRRLEALLGGRPLSVGFIDGLHLFEQSLRDFINVEAHCGPNSAILIHDTVPLDELTQRRDQETQFHTGDVWRTVLCLKKYRPDLHVFTIATPPTGLTVVTGLDPGSRQLSAHYDEYVAEFLAVPFAAIEGDLKNAVNLVPADFDAVKQLVLERRSVGSDTAGHRGSYIVDRDQPALSPADVEAVDRFHSLYYQRWTEQADTINLSWFGYRLLKCPMDLWMYQELLVRTRPDVVVETGTFNGGSALYLANILDQIGHGQVITIDTEAQPGRPVHPRIEYVLGSSVDPEVVSRVRDTVDGRRVMLILDSDHTEGHVHAEMTAYSPLVKIGDYMIVEDTNVNGHPAWPGFGAGPMEAVNRFLAERQDFEIDSRCERFLMTLNPRGYLRRVDRRE